MPASRLVAWLLTAAVVAIGGLWAAYVILFANPNSNRGLHLVVALDAAEVRNSGLDALANLARGHLRDARIAFDGPEVVEGAVQVRIAKPEEVDAALKALRAIGPDVEIGSSEGGQVTLTQPLATQTQRLANAVGLTIDILRRRFDAASIAIRRIEPEGQGRIHVHAPNPADGPRVRDLIAKAGRLSLHEVHPSVTGREVEGGRLLPAGFRIYRAAETPADPFLLRTAPIVRGDELADAGAGMDAQINVPIITFRLSSEGARKLGRFTQANVGRPLAIVIDGVVVSAPVIREPILGGAGQISGNFTPGDAQQLAIRLKSGALPAGLTVVEERVVTTD